MSTRSSIAVQHEDGTVEAVYCHFDGYLTGVGTELVLHHDSLQAAEDLVSLGNLSTVCKKVEAYSRDRGERFDDNAPMKYMNLEKYFHSVASDIGDNGYRYIFKDGDWYVWGNTSRRSDAIKVEKALAQENP